ncbi:MAG: alpha/beta hydrolase [Deltaproteobacteria bacterium]|nr:alpha/beta hydrolase [Deltaproteobacteria bacterium]
MKTIEIIIGVLLILIAGRLSGQELTIEIGEKHTIKSGILSEDREILIHLPENYNSSEKAYPVLYRLDGSQILLTETFVIVNRLTYSYEITPEMIIVAVKNIERDKDMWPVNTKYYPEFREPGAANFLGFIKEELLPYIDDSFRTTDERILCGQSLSSVFVLYTFLKQPGLFDSYIAISGAFPGCEEYFSTLTEEALMQKDRFARRKLFISNGLKDPLDPNGTMHRQMSNFTKLLDREIGDKISLKYLPYKNEGHVPFHSLYDGLSFLYRNR